MMQKSLIESGLEVWCDSEHDAEFSTQLYPNFKKIYFRVKGSLGHYHILNSEKRVESPRKIVELTEYEHPDIIISFNGEPFLSIEITCSNYWGTSALQRIPRSVRACELGVPNIFLANEVRSSPIARIPKVSLKLMEIYKVPSLVIFYKPNQFNEKLELLKKIVQERIKIVEEKSINDTKKFIDIDFYVIREMEEFCKNYYREKFRAVEIHDNYIKINIDITGKRRYSDTPTGWETKGTGLLDPYPGCILAYDFLLCRTGPKVTDRKRKVIVHFRKIPRSVKSPQENPATWWVMKARESKSFLYWNLIEKFSDKIIFKGENISDLEK
jgi:hypothetical protein